MKKLKKFTIEALRREMPVLEEAEERGIVGGSGIDGLCVFNCLTYLSGLFGCEYDINYYINSFAETNGFAGVLYGVNQSDFFSFTASNFETSSLMSGTQIAGSLNANNQMLAAINTGGGQHAVILTNYHNLTDYYHLNVYTYYDPTTGYSGIVSANDVIMGISVSGCCN
jgi:hypothetical protein